MNWRTDENHLLLNPRLPDEQRQILIKAWQELVAPAYKAHLGVTTSGTTTVGLPKLVLLSKEAILCSARSVNRALQTTSADIWLMTLPESHVGGLGIRARAHVGGFQVSESCLPKWQVRDFYQELCAAKATLLSLVPTQVFDIVAAQLPAPPHLRAAVIGGGALSEDLFVAAQELGWPVLPSFGLTEACSQVATAPLGSKKASLELLDHVEAKTDDAGFLWLKGESLLSAYLHEGRLFDPKEKGWLKLEDRGQILSREIQIHGRNQDFLKISGENVNLPRLEAALQKARSQSAYLGDLALLAVPDSRLGTALHLLLTGTAQAEGLLAAYHHQVLPVEKIRVVHKLHEIPRSPLGKLLRAQALALIGFEPSANR